MSLTDTATLLRSRNITTIPKDQQALLEKDDCWAVNLKLEQHGAAHIPGHVLESVKQAYLHRQQTKQENENPAAIERPAVQDVEPTSNHVVQEMEQEDESAELEVGKSPRKSISAQSSPEREIPWSSSPARPEAEEIRSSIESPIVHTTPSHTAPMLSPSRPEPQPQAAPVFDFPSSFVEEEEEEDMDIRLPQAQGERGPAVNRVAAHPISSLQSTGTNMTTTTATTAKTPPCAQPAPNITIPDTEMKEKLAHSVPGAGPASRRARRMKPILFSDDSPVKGTKSLDAPASVVRMPCTKEFPEQEVWNSTTSSSIIPATFQNQPQLSDVANLIARPPDPIPPPPTNPFVLEPAPLLLEQGLPLSSYRLLGSPLPSTNPQRPHQAHQLAYLMASRPTDPYTNYVSTYPDYITGHNGNLWYFIQACVCLEYLQKVRALREYLYDDFVRAYSGGFVKYVRKAGPGQQPLPAIEWFNMREGPILFNRMSIRKSNLGEVLDAYPEEVARARAIIIVDEDEDEVMEVEKEALPKPAAKRSAEELIDVDERETPAPRPQKQPRPHVERSQQQQPRQPEAAQQILPRVRPPKPRPESLPQPQPEAQPRTLPKPQPQALPTPLPQPLPKPLPQALPKPLPQALPQAVPQPSKILSSPRPLPPPSSKPSPKPPTKPTLTRQPSPELGTEAPRRPAQPPSPSVTRAAAAAPTAAPKAPSPKPNGAEPPRSSSSTYGGHLVSSNRANLKTRKRSAAEKAKLLEHFRRKKETALVSSGRAAS